MFHGEVIDLKVVGSKAKITWKMTRGPTHPDFQDAKYGVVVVFDNGDGSKEAGTISWGMLVDRDGCCSCCPGRKSLQELIDMSPDEYINLTDAIGWLPTVFPYVFGDIYVR